MFLQSEGKYFKADNNPETKRSERTELSTNRLHWPARLGSFD